MRQSTTITNLWPLCIVVLFAATWMACSTAEPEPEQQTAADTTSTKVPATGVKPPSELALLMRAMTNDFEQARNAYLNGKLPTFVGAYDLENIYHATPTDSTVKTPAFRAMAYSFIQDVKEFVVMKDPNTSEQVLFNNMIGSCIDCHKTYCPGPVKRIRKLIIPDSLATGR